MKKLPALFILFLAINISAQNVYKTPSGSKYHFSTCRMVKNVSSTLSLISAQKQGLTGCKICKPPSVSGKYLSTKKKAQGTNSLSQCRGVTKIGKRCKRKTRIGNDFCFQHLP